MSKVELGQVVMTNGVDAEIPEKEYMKGLQRHSNADWGNVCKQDKKANDKALKEGFRVISSYDTDDGTTYWIITEADRSVTTILLPSEY